MSSQKIETKPLHKPNLDDLVPILTSGLSENFKNVQVRVVDCPKLDEKPFHLCGEGLCGNTSVVDVGGPPYLLPSAQVDRPQYKFEDIFKAVDLENDGLLIGAGAGPHQNVGVNCEMAANVGKRDGKVVNETRIVKVVDYNSYQMERLKHDEFALLANFFCCEGKPGKVLEVTASDRTGELNYISCIRQTLAEHFGPKPVGLGGVFLLEKGKAKLHVMPKFSEQPLYTDDDVNHWLKFFEMNAPLICFGELVSHDPGLDLRMEHFHCFSNHDDGGHYHYDVTPREVVYRGYFNVAERVIRVDRPEVTHQVGRD